MLVGYLVEALEYDSRGKGWAFWGKDNLPKGILTLEVIQPVTEVFLAEGRGLLDHLGQGHFCSGGGI